ncbi:MAG: hypothetical protein KME64_02630 [Scytonematopsis contorta HA4267-MV1]|jgi:hypothetical protein|nr:hypothetical protein [Scytonematopsis contorta HA4267-MV1]
MNKLNLNVKNISKLKTLAALTVSGLLLATITAQASSPEQQNKHNAEVKSSCLKVSALRNAKASGNIIQFGDDIGYDALLVSGNYPQPHMKNRPGKFLCLFNRKTRKAVATEAN